MNLNLIKMLECMSVRLFIWLYGKLVRERKTSAKTKKIHIILTLKNAKFVNLERTVIQMEQKAKHTIHTKLQETDYFKEKSKERYKIEEKNSELKHRHGYDVSKSSGLIGMEMQGAMAIFTVNLKRIMKLMR